MVHQGFRVDFSSIPVVRRGPDDESITFSAVDIDYGSSSKPACLQSFDTINCALHGVKKHLQGPSELSHSMQKEHHEA